MESRPRRARLLLVGLALLVALVVAGTLYAVLSGPDQASNSAKNPPTPTTSKSPSATPAPKPTEQGIENFIRDYVAAVAEDPAKSWQMLTPKFQVESGGFETYRKFWQNATNGRVLSISANPDNLSVSYQVRFDGIDNGPGPTVLDLKFEDGNYLIDGERTQGFVPAS